MKGLQCEKYLYLDVHHRDLATPISESQKNIFDQGNAVGFEAQKLFPQGVEVIAEYWDVVGGFEKTKQLIDDGVTTLFEATIIYEGISARTDILNKRKNGKWEIIEVKSSASVKAQYIDDSALQYWVFKNHGFELEKISVMHINSKYLHPEKDKLFKKVDVTEDVLERLSSITKLTKSFQELLLKENTPEIDIGPHCTFPYPCSFYEHCWKHIPTPSVFDIPGMKQEAWNLYKENKFEIKKLSESDFSPKQARAIHAFKTGKRFIDKEIIQKGIADWKWPIYFLDFETFNSALPLYEHTKPFQQIPFQFSCHVLKKVTEEPTHFEYLHQDETDPREPLAQALCQGFGDSGSIVAYNKAFEAGVIKELEKLYPEYREKLLSLVPRLVDPWPIMREGVYDPAFLSSYSLKSVAPAILGAKMDYEHLEIGDGKTASRSYLSLIKGDLRDEEKNKARNAMLQYCRQDTLATVELVKWLYKSQA
ncbi:MAG: DUF2779 domain-containing protein [Xanthomonadaceae bacterium]|nr:DUF2779 domain-containing protein [Xanthomonadaceae bacterium]